MAVIFSFILQGCAKENKNNNEIPVVQVSFSINPNSTEYLQLNSVNGWVYLKGGYRGIIVFRVSMNEFMAFERACPYDWDQTNARLDVEAAGTTCACPNCKSKFILLDGSPFQGPSSYPLKQYQTHYDGSILYIYN